MRPALDGHAGIPQETRLLFRGLSLLDNVHVEGLLQTSGRVLAPGLPPAKAGRRAPLPTDQQLNRLGQVVITIEQSRWDDSIRAAVNAIGMVIWHLLGGKERLTLFDSLQFRDFLWHRFFARTLQPADFDVVTSAAFRIAHLPWTALQICGLLTAKLGYALYPRLDTADFDVMIVETPYPASVSRRTKLIVRYHDAIPLLMPHTISDRSYHQAAHYHTLRKNVQSGAWFVCVSEATRKDLLSIFPQLEARSLTIHNMVSHNYFDEASSAIRVPEIIKTRLNTGFEPPLDPSLRHRLFEGVAPPKSVEYLLIVSTVEPRKNHLTLLSAWEWLRVEKYPALKLVIVGTLGWHNKEIVRKFRPWMDRGDVLLLQDVPPSELRVLYKHARATVCPSFGEGFGYSGVEAMKSGGVVIASDIAVHREVYSDAAEYFNPYSVDDLSRAIQDVIDAAHPTRRAELVTKGASVSCRYDDEAILPKWRAFLFQSQAAI